MSGASFVQLGIPIPGSLGFWVFILKFNQNKAESVTNQQRAIMIPPPHTHKK